MNIKFLAEILEQKKITQKELSELIGVRPNTITNLKKGVFKITTLEKVAKALNVPKKVIFSYHNILK